MVKAYLPRVEVMLIKTVQRERVTTQTATGAKDYIDLTPFLAEGSVVRFMRGINEDAGTFSIDIPDQPSKRTDDTVYSMIEPMDMIEIRMAREPHKYDQLPVVFRGFVSYIRRSEQISGNRPNRRVIISGRDWGSILQSIQIFYKKDYINGRIMLDAFPMFSAYGTKFELMTPTEFVETVIDKVVNPWLDELWLESTLKDTLRLHVRSSVTQGRVGPNGFQAYEGGIMSFLQTWTDLQWNELIFDDDDNGTYLLYRPKPYKDIENQSPIGDWIEDESMKPIRLGIDAVVSLDVSRALDNVFNYFHVEAPISYLNNPLYVNVEAMQKGSVFVLDHPNNNPALYGLRKISAQSNMDSEHNAVKVTNLKTDDKKKHANNTNDWLGARRDTLKDMNKDNVVFEKGSMKLRGDERLKPGKYLELERGNLQAEYYIKNVNHTFVVLGAYTTDIEFIRGTGFIERLKTPNYNNEVAQGVY